jgi:ADP-ribosylglycohydrolase
MLTDDTQLTLATCEAIVATGGVGPESIAAEMARAFRAGTLVGLGASTYQALELLAAGGHWALAGRTGDRAAGNGAAMRVAPLAFCLELGAYRERQLFRDVCRITHRNDEAYAGALAIALAIQSASLQRWSGGPGLIADVARQLPDSAVRDRLRELENLNPKTPLQDIGAQFGSSGYAVESVPLALFAAQQAHDSDFTVWLRGVIAVGGDTDTIASMAGQIAGCCLTIDRLPAALIARVPGIEQMREKIAAFAERVVVGEMARG